MDFLYLFDRGYSACIFDGAQITAYPNPNPSPDPDPDPNHDLPLPLTRRPDTRREATLCARQLPVLLGQP